MRRIQVLVTRSAAGASVVGYFQKRKPVPAPVRAVVFAEFWPDRHIESIVSGVGRQGELAAQLSDWRAVQG